MKEFTKDFEFSHNGSTTTKYKASEPCELTGFALKCAENREAVKDVEDKKEAPKTKDKELPKGDDKEAPKTAKKTGK